MVPWKRFTFYQKYNAMEKIISGDNLYFRLIREEDIDNGWLNWINDINNSETLDLKFPSSRESLINYINDSLPPKAILFAVVEIETNNFIGTARIVEIDHTNRSCNYGRFIGDTSLRGKGYGTEIVEIIQQYVFEQLSFNRLYTHNLDINIKALNSNKKAGMKVEGTLRESQYYKGNLHDLILLSMLKDEYFSKKKK
jgi:RimJ/RimL family protein N-acetyltransferase